MTDEISTLDGYDEITEVHVPQIIVTRIESRLSNCQFDTADEYITYILEEVIAKLESEIETISKDNVINDDEIKERLDALGYMDR